MFRTLRQSAAVGAGDLVDDALDEDDSYMDAAGYVGQEFGDEVVGGCGGQSDGVARG